MISSSQARRDPASLYMKNINDPLGYVYPAYVDGTSDKNKTARKINGPKIKHCKFQLH